MLDLTSVTETALLLDPAGNRIEQRIEHRKDPLTSTIASINFALGEKARMFLGTSDLALLEELQEKSKGSCPFCACEEKGTRYAPELVPEGQLRRGNTVALPNLFSKCRFDSVVIIDRTRHVLFPSRIGRDALADAMCVSADLVRRARAHDPAQVHHVVGMNFLQPGGSSVPHPHFQVQVRSVAYSGVARVLQASAAFLARTGRHYFRTLLDQEQALGARFIGSTGAVQWLAAFAPAHQKELWGVLPSVASFAELGDADAASFAEGIDKVISFYEECGSHPFTFAFFSSPSPGDAEHFALHLKLCARPALRQLYPNYDTWFTPKMLGEDVHTEAPEEHAARLRARW